MKILVPAPMKRVILILLLSALSVIGMAQNRHALLIGIGQYPKESGWRAIDGDTDVPVMRQALIRQGFSGKDITELVNGQATKEGILKAIRRLTNISGKGDLVFILFSGHGQQITDTDGDEKSDNPDDDFDEAWIPYDAGIAYKKGVYEGENHLTDDELNVLLYAIREKVGANGKIIVIADACHSGGGSRALTDDDDAVMRGWSEEFVIPRNAWSRRTATSGVDREATDPWLYVAACGQYESNFEYKAGDGKYYGVLTYIISQDSNIFSRKNYSDILEGWNRTLTALRSRPFQTITPSGEPNKVSATLF